jgi:isopenicillin N synthase-like dioxygenase
MLEQLPTLNLSTFVHGSAGERTSFVAALGQAYTDIGFVAIKDHGLEPELERRLYNSVQSFFDLPQEAKDHYNIPGIGGQRGYTPKGMEHAKGRSVGDLKEFYHVGQLTPPKDASPEDYPTNIFPKEVPDFQDATVDTFLRLEVAGRQILRAIALYLELNIDYFEDKVRGGNSILRPIHYFPIEDPDSVPADAVRAAEHEDINLITLLMGASADGLQVLRRDGQWIAITALPQHIVVNVGDMLQRLTNNKLRSTTHRVVNPPREQMGTSRYSIPFFMHPRAEMDLSCLPSCVAPGEAPAYEPITAGEYLHQRLREIGLKN